MMLKDFLVLNRSGLLELLSDEAFVCVLPSLPVECTLFQYVQGVECI